MAYALKPAEMAEEVAPDYRRRSRRMWMMCLALSLALHLWMLLALPGFIESREPLQAQVLDVVLLRQSEPSAPVRAEVAPEPPRKRTRDIPASAKMPEHPKRAAEQARKPESGPAKPAAITLDEPAPAPDPFPLPAVSVKQDGVNPAAPRQAGTTAAGRDMAAISPPVFNAAYLRNPPPSYPLVARRNGEQGAVTLRVRVTREGAAASVAIEKTSGSAHLDDAALETVRTWRFVPARQGGQPVEAWVLVPVVFKLEPVS